MRNGSGSEGRIESWRARGSALLLHPRLPLLLALLGAALVSPALTTGWQVDDLFQRWILLRGGSWTGIAATPGDLFSFIDGVPAHVRRLMDVGIIPWWSVEDLKFRFFRPLAVLSLRLDYALWRDSAALMHVHSIAWFGALVGAAGLLYRRLAGVGAAAGLAAYFFAVDDAHGVPAGWIANRNALLGGVLGIAALLAHNRWRKEGWRAGAWWAPLLFALALLSSESAASCAAYLLAYAVFLEEGRWQARVRSLLPYLGVGAAWLALLRLLGYGAAGSGLYLDPLGEPLVFFASFPKRMLLLLLGQWGFPPAEAHLFLPPGAVRLLLAGAAVFLGLLGVFLIPALRRSTTARFFGSGMVLALVPVCATFPDNRLLLWSGLGAMGLLGEAVALRERGRFATTMRVILLVMHAAAAPLLLPVAARSFGTLGPLLQGPATGLAAGKEIASQDLVIVDHPLPFFAHYLIPVRDQEGLPFPGHVRVLAPGSGPLEISRPDARTLVVRPREGFLSSPLDVLFRTPSVPLRPGAVVELTGFRVEVGASGKEGRPAVATFRFAQPLESPALRWVRWEGGAYVPFAVPPVGAAVTLAPQRQIP